jgi:hypothetical protein
MVRIGNATKMIQELGYRHRNREVLAIGTHNFFDGMRCSQSSSGLSIDQAPCVDRPRLIQLCNIIDRFVFMWILKNEILHQPIGVNAEFSQFGGHCFKLLLLGLQLGVEFDRA